MLTNAHVQYYLAERKNTLMKYILFFLFFAFPVFAKSQTVIKMKREGGVSIIPCKVNGLNLNFIFDTGASDVSISLTEANFMLKNGYLRESDFIGTDKYLDASGSISEGIVINLRLIEIAGLEMTNIRASIEKNLHAPLLLGQSAISKLGKFQLDLKLNTLTILNGEGAYNYSDYSSKKTDTISGEGKYFTRAHFKFLSEDYTGALDDYNKVIKINPDFPSAYFNRAGTKTKLQDYSGALDDYSEAIKANPKDAEAYNNRGNVKADLKDYQGAIADLNEAIEINPKYADAYCNRGNVKAELQDYRGALSDFDKAIKNNSNNAVFYYNRGNVKDERKDYQGALTDLNKAIQINPKFGEAYINRGLVKIKLGQKNSGCLDLSKAGELGHTEAYDIIKDFCN